MAKVICIASGRNVSQLIADHAYSLWLAREFRAGSPEGDLRRAISEYRFTRAKSDVSRLVVLPRRFQRQSEKTACQ